jgi:hypothetical protein
MELTNNDPMEGQAIYIALRGSRLTGGLPKFFAGPARSCSHVPAGKLRRVAPMLKAMPRRAAPGAPQGRRGDRKAQGHTAPQGR